MKITDVQAIHVRVEDPNIGIFDGSYDDCLIFIQTDEGVTGIGEVESLDHGILPVRTDHVNEKVGRYVLVNLTFRGQQHSKVFTDSRPIRSSR